MIERVYKLMNTGRWTIKLSSALLLLSVLVVIVLILVLPDVDLLDTAFQRGTAPLTARSQANASPVFRLISGSHHFSLPSPVVVFRNSSQTCVPDTNSRFPILYRSLRC